ncbi:MAG TPA: hypothetical protein VG013_17205 [Gemmataceae bacterium]|nr:hypothetical protein [Gemmataceae bacterium]
MLPCILMLSVVACIIAFILIATRLEKKRTEAMQRAGAAMGLTFCAEGPGDSLASFAGLYLFSQGREGYVTNFMRGETNETELSIFDYEYRTGSGRKAGITKQTVICILSDKLHLPDFSLRPEHIFHKIGAFFGFQDVDFEAHPEFSSHYLLRGSNEEAIRAQFHQGVLCFFDGQPGLCTEGSGNRLVFYRANQRVKPKDLRSFMDEGLHMASLFMK